MLKPGVIATFPWGRGAGKSFYGRFCIHEWCLTYPGINVGLLMPTLKQARAVFWPGLLDDYYGGLKPFVQRPNLTELVCVYRNGSRVTTWGAENARSILGQRFACLIEDEADDIHPDVERTVVEPTFSKTGSKAIWLRTGTPRRGRYGSLFKNYQRGQDGTPERKALAAAGIDPNAYVSMRVRSDESPQVNAPWLERTKRDLLLSGKKTTWLREYCCEFDAAEGLVYSMFEQDFHVRMPNYGAPWTEILVGCDYGTADPGVFLVCGVMGQGRDAIVHCLEEVYETDKDTTWWMRKAVEVAGRYKQFRQRWYHDPSRPDRILDYRRAVREAHPQLGASFSIDAGMNEIEAGVDAVADRLMPRDTVDADGNITGRTARLYVSPRCEHLIEEMSLYRRKRDPKNEERVLDDIVDKYNHATDSLRYACYTRFGGPDKSRHEIAA